ncbi:hypothetical protein ES705_26810 [subsurface metagenome]
MHNGFGFYDIKPRIDTLTVEYSDTNFKTVVSYFSNKGITEYFFRRLTFVKTPLAWLKPLLENGYLDPKNNPGIQEIHGKPGFYQVPYWHILDYLVYTAKVNEKHPNTEINELLTNLVNSIINYKGSDGKRVENIHTDLTMVKILSRLPVTCLNSNHIEFIENIMKSRWDKSGVTLEIQRNLLPKLLNNKKKDFVLRLLDMFFQYKTEKGDFRDRYTALTDTHAIYEVLKKNKKGIAELCGIEAARMIIEKMKTIVKEDKSQFNNILIPTIEDHYQTRFPERFTCQLVHFVRDMLELSAPKQVRSIVNNLVKEEHPIFKRISIHIINQMYEFLKDLFWNWDRNPLDETLLKHEIYELLSKHCTSFDKNEWDTVLNWIESRKYYIPKEIQGDDKKIKKLHARYKREWLEALIKTKKPEVLKKYEDYKNISPMKIEHPGFDSWMETKFGYVSPITIEDLCNKDNSEIANCLQKFEEKRGLDESSVEGLSEVFRECVKSNPKKFSTDLGPFLMVKRTYIHTLLLGLLEAWRAAVDYQWNEILDFMSNLIKTEVARKSHYIDGSNNCQNWIAGLIADIIYEWTKSDKHTFDFNLLPKVESILFELTNNISAGEYDITERPIIDTMNSTKYHIYAAMVNYSLKAAEQFESDAENKWVDKVQTYFERLLDRKIKPSLDFSVVLGSYLLHFCTLNKNWVTHNINMIFPKDQPKHWKAAFGGYLFYITTVYEEIYDLLRLNGHYEKAIKLDFDDKFINERLVQHICIGYKNSWDNLDDNKSLMRILIENKTKSKLSEIIDFFWRLRQESSSDMKDKVMALWKMLFELSSENIHDTGYQKILSDLVKWLSLVDEIDEDIFKWLRKSIKYFSIQPNESIFLEYLLKFVSKDPSRVGQLYIKMLESGVYPYYKEEHIKAIIEKLYKKGEKALADKICNMYGQEGYEFLNLGELYQKYQYRAIIKDTSVDDRREIHIESLKTLKALIERIVKGLVDKPEAVEVIQIAGEKTVIFELKVNVGDLGKVIGKEGRTAKAVRTILTAAAMKQGKRTVLEILE